jgi:hypothetical protein
MRCCDWERVDDGEGEDPLTDVPQGLKVEMFWFMYGLKSLRENSPLCRPFGTRSA